MSEPDWLSVARKAWQGPPMNRVEKLIAELERAYARGKAAGAEEGRAQEHTKLAQARGELYYLLFEYGPKLSDEDRDELKAIIAATADEQPAANPPATTGAEAEQCEYAPEGQGRCALPHGHTGEHERKQPAPAPWKRVKERGRNDKAATDAFIAKVAAEVEARPSWQKGAIDRPGQVQPAPAPEEEQGGCEITSGAFLGGGSCARGTWGCTRPAHSKSAPAPAPRTVCEKGCVTGCDGFGCAAPAPAEKVFATLDAMDKRHADAVADLKRQVDALEAPGLTDAELDAMEARANAATPGPWRWTFKPGREESRAWLIGQFDASGGNGVHGAGVAAPGQTIEDACLSTAITGNGSDSKANALFVSHARTDLPRLVSAYRALQAECERLRGYQSKNHALREEVGSLSEEVARLKEALTEIRQPHYGVEMTDTDAEQLEYWSKRCVALMDIARRALRGAK